MVFRKVRIPEQRKEKTRKIEDKKIQGLERRGRGEKRAKKSRWSSMVEEKLGRETGEEQCSESKLWQVGRWHLYKKVPALIVSDFLPVDFKVYLILSRSIT